MNKVDKVWAMFEVVETEKRKEKKKPCVSDVPLHLTHFQILTLNHHNEPSIIFPKYLPDILAISALLNYNVVQP